ncbi:SDR family NAD(P)-dependent oxidoreductase [Pseudomonas abietaniphila]|uniref:SDR family NAD(P)-dependent oxidoreductase n=1 Tax=Pseudomonas abietaniphila TaxID=89065 RepID=UPI0007821587|nr:SDR family NAD(P)-dependent oxidoreductase [Pseudomonas abietaniphila]
MNRRFWLTGASSGIGLALAEELLKAGHRVALTARTLEPLEALHQRFGQYVLLAPGDVTDPEQVTAIGQRIAQGWGAVDTVILNAGTCEYIDARQFDARLVERVVTTNLIATAYCIQEALVLLRLGERPHLVGVASSVALLPLTRSEAYGASKAGLRYLLQSLRIDLAQEGIDVTIISPGFVDTPLTAKNDFPMPMRWSAPKAAQHIAERLEKSRRPFEIAFPFVFILLLKAMAILPARLQLALCKRMVRAPAKTGATS